MTKDPKSAETVWYDGACPVCSAEIAAYRRMAGLAGIDWQDATRPDADLGPLDRDAALARFHARRADGRIVSGARAFTAVWRRSPRLRPVARLADAPGLIQLLELAYRAFLRLRPIWRKPG